MAMKIGDKVRSTKVRPNDAATIIKSNVALHNKRKDDRIKKEIRSSYEASYEDGSKLIFYGFDIGKTIFKVEDDYGQIHLGQFMDLG